MSAATPTALANPDLPGALNAATHAALMDKHGPESAYEVALSLVQQRGGTTAHIGGRDSFQMRGCGHYGESYARRRLLFGQPGEDMPPFLRDYDWGLELAWLTPRLLPPDLGLIECRSRASGRVLRMSGDVRAQMEAFAVVPEWQELDEAQLILDLKAWSNPAEVQTLLESCEAPLVARVYMHLAEKARLPWVGKVALGRVDFGEGIMELGVDGLFPTQGDDMENWHDHKELFEKYQLWLPKETRCHYECHQI